jgi:hypothetical protein
MPVSLARLRLAIQLTAATRARQIPIRFSKGMLSKKHASALSRRDAPESCRNFSPQRGRGECRVPIAPAALRAKVESTQASHHGRTGTPGIPARSGFNGYSALSPVIGLVCHRRWRDCFHQLDAGVEASGPHVFAARFSAIRYQHIHVHRIPPRVRDDREPPL